MHAQGCARVSNFPTINLHARAAGCAHHPCPGPLILLAMQDNPMQWYRCFCLLVCPREAASEELGSGAHTHHDSNHEGTAQVCSGKASTSARHRLYISAREK